ncbi:DUF1707 SHOCT-like domain-containing protein [Solirubrobacter ginsenosidimutans]|uniref:DUF1707 SHOCT-like domain-containing protein n=1 Tax=Solirubrobacter ginsenosidimutans TaxID=490573 RepID=UPI0035569563
MRIGDADRDATARELREHWSLGRLDADELEDRLETAYRAKTRGDLDALIADLPEIREQRSAEAPAHFSSWRRGIPRGAEIACESPRRLRVRVA